VQSVSVAPEGVGESAGIDSANCRHFDDSGLSRPGLTQQTAVILTIVKPTLACEA